MRELRSDYPLAVLCRVLRVSRSGYQAWLVRQPSRRAVSRARLKVAPRRQRIAGRAPLTARCACNVNSPLVASWRASARSSVYGVNSACGASSRSDVFAS